MLSSVRVVTSDIKGDINVSVNDMRASKRIYERMYVRVNVCASEDMSVRPCVYTITCHAHAHV